mmetsp:Transcript_11856/g.34880  ORF Transcript_11856/g.34880 Transcript_11856/m.34880 type:complete len:197 (-) Transcript_11856:39-629(-)
MIADWFFAVPRENAEWMFEKQMLGVLEPNDRNGHSPAGWDKNEGDNCINGALYHGPESLLTPRLREWANRTQDATGIFPVALLRFRHPGASTNTRHRIGDELKRHGVYELECRIVPRLPSTFKSSCLEIDHALHSLSVAKIGEQSTTDLQALLDRAAEPSNVERNVLIALVGYFVVVALLSVGCMGREDDQVSAFR